MSYLNKGDFTNKRNFFEVILIQGIIHAPQMPVEAKDKISEVERRSFLVNL